jgi:hypothetical protein
MTTFRIKAVQHCLKYNQKMNLGHKDTTSVLVKISNANPVT